MAVKRFRELLSKVKPGARERSRKNAPEPTVIAPEPAAPIDRSLPEYLGAAAELRDAGRFEEADALLTEAMKRFPDERRLRFDWALLPHFRLDWTEAVRRSEIVRAEFPDAPAAHALGAIVLRELGRYDDAENLLSAAREQFPDDLRIANESAWLATHRQNWAEALRRWGLVRKRFPDWPGGYTGTAMIYRELTWFDEAEVTLEDAVERFPAEPELWIEFARLAEARGDRREAARRWQAVREHFPEEAPESEASAAALHERSRQDEAEGLLAEAAGTCSTDALTAMEVAAETPAQEPVLEDSAAETPAQEPALENIAAETSAAAEPAGSDPAIRVAQDRPEQVADDTTPEDPEPFFRAARAAAAERDWGYALELWIAARSRFPKHPAAHTGAAVALREVGRFDEAGSALLMAQEWFPDDPGPTIEYAWLAHAQRDWPEAEQRWEALRRQFPDNPWGYFGGGRSLFEEGRLDAADALLVEGRDRFPRDAGIAVAWAECAVRRDDWKQALARWDKVHDVFPENVASYSGAAAALHKLGRSDEAELLLLAAQERFPETEALFVEHAWLVHTRRDWTTEAALWERVRERFPSHVTAYVRGAVALREAGRVVEAEELLRVATERFPQDAWAFIEYALLAQTRQDWPEASQRWSEVRARFPTNGWGYSGAARALLEMGDNDAAEALLADATARFPGEAGVAFAWAEAAARRRVWSQAVERWEAVRERFPDQSAGYVQGANALREFGRLDDAEALISEAMQRFPDDGRSAIEFAMIAHIRRDLPVAIARWQELRRRFPGELIGYTMGSLDLFNLNRDDEAEAVLREAMERLPNAAEPRIEYARVAERRRRWPVAIRRWKEVQTRFPERVEGWTGRALALSSDGRHDEAEELLETAHARFPQTPQIACEYAWAAYRQHRWDEAEQRFALVRERFFTEPVGYRGGAAVLINRGELDGAEKMLEEGMARASPDPFLMLEHARIPASPLLREERNWDVAISRLEALCSRFPDFEHGHIDLVRTLRDRGRLDEAEAAGSRGLLQRARGPLLGIEYARVAQERDDWDEALGRYRTVTEQFPDQSAGFVGEAEALSHLGRFDEAEALLVQAMGSFPAESGPHAEHARLAMRRGEPEEALRRWASAVQSFPDDAQLAQELFVARLRVAETDPAAASAAERQNGENESASATTTDDLLPMRDLVQCFESLGGTALGCEFGLFQREFGAEPLGLLRWTDMEPDALIAALAAEFEGVGLSENTELVTPPNVSGEYATRDRRFGMRMHTFVSARQMPPDQMFAQVCRRLQFLRDKLLVDLKSSDKVFVYKITARNLTDDELRRLYTAVRRYGDNTLLYVRYADAQHPAGVVEMTEPGLLIGYVDHFAMSTAEENLGAQTVAWSDICRKAYHLWRTQAASRATPATVPDEPDREPADRSDLGVRDLVTSFESLGGGGHGCEFGIFQRACGAEPLGLLRWADLAPHLLAEALESEFDGVGISEHTEVFVPEGSGPAEYWTRDRRYWMVMRTFVPVDELPMQQMRERACRRLCFLRQKLIDDLRDGDKIFVYKVIERNLSDSEIDRIRAAMRRYGENTLLYVRHEDSDHPNGTVEIAAPGLMIGYIDHFSYSPEDSYLGDATESWLAICENAYRLQSSANAANAAAGRNGKKQELQGAPF